MNIIEMISIVVVQVIIIIINIIILYNKAPSPMLSGSPLQHTQIHISSLLLVRPLALH